MNRERWNPWKDILAVQRAFTDAERGDRPLGLGDELYCSEWVPAADIYDEGAQYRLRLELPGLSREDVAV
ncbi:hypothetical protein JW905_16235, partial [bacterium]|nr:hypothetical protein [candidate division CSSED10-310 bacterium]